MVVISDLGLLIFYFFIEIRIPSIFIANEIIVFHRREMSLLRLRRGLFVISD
jgi:hypothetical protein